MKIGIVGKPNVGKSTFFAAATLAEAEIANYPFTTIEANRGMAYVRVPDPGPGLGVTSTPRTGRVHGDVRYVPIEVVDVAGLVPGAHEGRGLGNRFLSDLAQADALVHVVDASGGTDAEGNPVDAGTRDPLEDVRFLDDELDLWIAGILDDGWVKLTRRVQQEGSKFEAALAERLTGLGVDEARAHRALQDAGMLGMRPSDLPKDATRRLATAIRRRTKPMLVALNKADVADGGALGRVREHLERAGVAAVPSCAQAELALGRGAASGALDYAPGAGTFAVRNVTPQQQKGLAYIGKVLERLGSTGVHKALETAAFGLLHLVPVFPVEDESHFTDKQGRVLPDCHLVPAGTTARQLAYRVHTDLGENFVRAIDCRTRRAVGGDHPLEAGAVVKIAAAH